MALQIANYEDTAMRTSEAAHLEILKIVVDYERRTATATAKIWASFDAYEAGARPVEDDIYAQVTEDTSPSFTSLFGPKGSDKSLTPLAAAEAVLMGLPQFAKATKV